MALLGMLSLVGIVVNNAIVMLEQIEIERAGGRAPYDAIVQACLARMRPIVMTALTTILGMMPIIISRDPSSTISPSRSPSGWPSPRW